MYESYGGTASGISHAMSTMKKKVRVFVKSERLSCHRRVGQSRVRLAGVMVTIPIAFINIKLRFVALKALRDLTLYRVASSRPLLVQANISFHSINELTENANDGNSLPEIVTCFVLFEKPLTFCYFLPFHLGQVSSSLDLSLKGSS